MMNKIIIGEASNLFFSQKVILDRISIKKNPTYSFNSYDVHGDSYADYIDEPYGDYYDTNSEEPN
ncbi:MAG: hypothetical protein MJZ72_00130 [Bacteroidales bacterium]|nr:hypothetical protein [Bacteroidales bacterium]